jgi:primary-amine oxidase
VPQLTPLLTRITISRTAGTAGGKSHLVVCLIVLELESFKKSILTAILAIGPIVHSTAINSTNVGKSVGWATHHLYTVKQKDTEPRSAHPYNILNVNDPVVNFDKFFDGESLDQEDLVIYFNLGTHHVPDTSDLPNTVFTSAQSGISIQPQNYLLGDASRATRQQVRVAYDSGNVTVKNFGAEPPSGVYNLSQNSPHLTKYTGDVVVRKFPYDPDNWYYEGDKEELSNNKH